MHITATTFQGLESTLQKELAALGATHIKPLVRAVQFEGDLELLYKANYELRTAIRLLVPIHRFKTKHENHLYKKVQEYDWAKHISLEDTFAINAVTASKYITHSKYLALKVKDAIIDQLRDFYEGNRPSINTKDPTFRFNVHLSRENVCTISLDSSGDPLYKRGYRVQAVEAPLNEVLAAGLIQLSGWQADRDLIDPMCGSGTILIEAALLAQNIPSQRRRKTFGFMQWRNYDPVLWKQVKSEAIAKVQDTHIRIYGSDKDLAAFEIAERNVNEAGVADIVEVDWRAFEKLKPPAEKGIIIMNPPYDVRLEEEDVIEFYKFIGDRLKQSFSGFDAWIISSNREALKFIGLRPSRKITLFNAALECRFQKYELYSGSKKATKTL